MKRLIVVLVLVFVSTSYSQILKNYGVKAGVTYTDPRWKEICPGAGFDGGLRGANAGVFGEFFNLPILSLLTEVNYVQKGFKVATYYENFDVRMHYVDIAMLAKATLEGGIVRAYMFIGPRLDHEFSRGYSTPSNITFLLDKNQFGLKCGAGAEVKVFNYGVLAEFVYDHGYGNYYGKKACGNLEWNSYDFRIGVII